MRTRPNRPMPRIAKSMLAIAYLYGLAACTLLRPDYSYPGGSKPQQIESDVASHRNLAGLLDLCRTAPRVDIFEGLPHPMAERELFAREQRRSDVFRNHDFRFYTPALSLPRNGRVRLLTGVTRESSFMPWRGPKLCGGFHPDLLLRFHHFSAVVDVHLCFGCGEAIFYGPATRAHVDFSEKTAETWRKIQRHNRAKRPAAAGLLPSLSVLPATPVVLAKAL